MQNFDNVPEYHIQDILERIDDDESFMYLCMTNKRTREICKMDANNRKRLESLTPIKYEVRKGNIIYEYYYIIQDGKKLMHRWLGPAFITKSVNSDGEETIFTEEYYRYNKYHNETGPAIKSHMLNDDDGSADLYREWWYLNGELYSKDGDPQFIEYGVEENGEIVMEYFAENGKYTKAIIYGNDRVRKINKAVIKKNGNNRLNQMEKE